MAFTPCRYEIGSPAELLAAAGLDYNAEACAVPADLNCGMNNDILAYYYRTAMEHDKTSNTTGVTALYSGSYSVCSLPASATNETYQAYQDCILNYPGRDGSFRCNDLETLNRSPTCNSLTGTINPPNSAALGQQTCVTGPVANSSGIMPNCCGSAPVSFEGGCWQYCVGPANENVGNCIQTSFAKRNISGGNVACRNGTGGTSTADPVSNASMASTMGLIAAIVWAVGLL